MAGAFLDGSAVHWLNMVTGWLVSRMDVWLDFLDD
jgi:hypothetical protein